MPYDTAGAKISQLPEATTPTDSDELAGVQNRVTKRFSLSGIKTWIKNWITKEDVGLSNVANVLQYSATNKPTGADVPYDGTTSGLSATTAQGAIDELAGEKQETIKGGMITFSNAWLGSGPYTQTVTVTGATVTFASKVDIQLTAAQISSLIMDQVRGLVIENNLGTLTAYAVGAAPSGAMTVQCTVEEIAV